MNDLALGIQALSLVLVEGILNTLSFLISESEFSCYECKLLEVWESLTRFDNFLRFGTWGCWSWKKLESAGRIGIWTLLVLYREALAVEGFVAGLGLRGSLGLQFCLGLIPYMVY
jgi:hypothetical protein